MKKLSIFLLGALAFAATSCEDGPSVPPIQSNPQGPVYGVDGVTVEQPTENTISLKDYADADKDIVLGNFQVGDFPAGCTLKAVTYISKDENFSSFAMLPTTLKDNTVYATAEDFQNVYVSSISKSPAEKKIYVRYAIYAVDGAQEYRVGSENSYVGGYFFNVTPFPSDLVLEQDYYLLGTINGWDVATALKLTHSDESPYDDPIYTIVVDITEDEAAAGWWWKIIPQSTYETGNWVDGNYSAFGPAENGSEDMSGVLAPSMMVDGKYEDTGAGCLFEFGTYLLTIDMVEGTYNFQLAVPHLYVMGDGAGWDWNSPLVAEMQTNDYVNYYAAALLSPGGYKFTNEKDWAASFNLGLGSMSADAGDWTLAGTLLNGSNDNILPETKGLYWNHVNLPALTFESYLVSSLGLAGDAVASGWDLSTDLTPSADFMVWEGDVEFLASGSFKIRANNAWVFSLGGDLNNLDWNNGANLDTPGAGIKHVKVDLTTYPYTMTIQ